MIKESIYTLCLAFILTTSLHAQLAISHLKHDHTTLTALDYEPYDGYYPFMFSYGKIIKSKLLLTANAGYGPGQSWILNDQATRNVYTAGLESEYYLVRHIEQYPLSLSINGKYQYEFHHQNSPESEHHFELLANGYYSIRFNKLTIAPHGFYGYSDFAFGKFITTHGFGGLIGYHFQDADYWYLSVNVQKYSNRRENRYFVSLGYVW